MRTDPPLIVMSPVSGATQAKAAPGDGPLPGAR